MKRTITHDQALAVLEQFINGGQRAQRAVDAATLPACDCGRDAEGGEYPRVHKTWCAYVQPALRALEERRRPITALDLLKLANGQMETCDCRPCTHCARELVAEAIDMLEAERH